MHESALVDVRLLRCEHARGERGLRRDEVPAIVLEEADPRRRADIAPKAFCNDIRREIVIGRGFVGDRVVYLNESACYRLEKFRDRRE